MQQVEMQFPWAFNGSFCTVHFGGKHSEARPEVITIPQARRTGSARGAGTKANPRVGQRAPGSVPTTGFCDDGTERHGRLHRGRTPRVRVPSGRAGRTHPVPGRGRGRAREGAGPRPGWEERRAAWRARPRGEVGRGAQAGREPIRRQGTESGPAPRAERRRRQGLPGERRGFGGAGREAEQEGTRGAAASPGAEWGLFPGFPLGVAPSPPHPRLLRRTRVSTFPPLSSHPMS